MVKVEQDSLMEEAKVIENYLPLTERWRARQLISKVDRIIRHCQILEEELRNERQAS